MHLCTYVRLKGTVSLDFITINVGCSLYGPVRSDFEAAVSIRRAICRGFSCSPGLFWASLVRFVPKTGGDIVALGLCFNFYER